MKVIKWWKLSSDESYQVMKVIKWGMLSSDESYQVKKIIKWWKLSSDGSYQVMKVIKWWMLSSDESYQVMKVIKWWKLSSDESYLVMKVIYWWKLSSDESYLLMNVREIDIAKEAIRSDGWWCFAYGDVFYNFYCVLFQHCCAMYWSIFFWKKGGLVKDDIYTYIYVSLFWGPFSNLGRCYFSRISMKSYFLKIMKKVNTFYHKSLSIVRHMSGQYHIWQLMWRTR